MTTRSGHGAEDRSWVVRFGRRPKIRPRVTRYAAVLLLGAGLATGADVDSERLNGAVNEPENWLTYYGTYDSWRYSPLDQINRSNIEQLRPVWAFESGVADGGLQAAPLVVDGTMYVSTAWNRVFALDAATGEQIWRYDYPKPDQIPGIYGTWNRGVAVAYGLVFMGTLDNHVLALDRETGEEVWRVEVENSKQCGCNITAAPLVVKDLVITGVTGGDSAHRGYINAFDARTGRHRWRFWTIPGPGEPGHDTWAGDSWVYGGGSTWVTGTYDPDLDLLYWAVGNPAADFYGGDREGDNLYTDSVVALDPDTGEIRWHYQQIPHDVWDYDTAYEMVLLDLEVDGVMRKTMLNPSKSGYVWLLDRQSGEFLGAWPLVESSNWIEGIDEQGRLIGRNEPPVGETSFVCPAIGGGRSWNHGAYSPQTGWFYSTGLEWCQTLTVRQEDPQEGLAFFGGEFEMAHPKSGEAHAHLSAYDPVTGERKWRYRHKYPLLASQLATAGGLVFSGDATGRFFALDASDGSELWSFRTGSGHRGSAITYSVGGRQYIATPSGWGSALAGLTTQLWPEAEHFPSGSSIFVFALPE
ncbi:MAG: PQQ-dependent dehydrogenase, methanol/ethanol family [Bryobacterales bacterium]|nr:PQQ-dependent dehydrogenase, methanol/ethanol family [Bryobacterales bacterium]